MRKLTALSVALALVGGAQTASAADLSYKDTPYVAPPAAIWTGFYIGGHVGGLWNDEGKNNLSRQFCWYNHYCYDWEKIEDVKFSDDADDHSLIGGIQVGYNWQADSTVFGIEADASFGDGVDYLASLRGRLGVAMDSLLVYATAGVAFVGLDDHTVKAEYLRYGTYGPKHEYEFDISGENKVGFVVGGGAEYKLDSNWSLGVEGLYYAFGNSDSSAEGYEPYCYFYVNKEFEHEDDNDLFVVRAKLNYHFQDDAYTPLK